MAAYLEAISTGRITQLVSCIGFAACSLGGVGCAEVLERAGAVVVFVVAHLPLRLKALPAVVNKIWFGLVGDGADVCEEDLVLNEKLLLPHPQNNSYEMYPKF